MASLLGPLIAARVSPPTRRSLLKGLLAYRWLAVAWATGVYAGEVWFRRSRDDLTDVAHPFVGAAVAAGVIALTLALTVLYRRNPNLLVRPVPVLTEVGFSAAILAADTWIFNGTDHSQSVPSVWVIGAVGAVAIAGGRRAAVITGLGIGAARFLGALPFATVVEATLDALSTIVLLPVAGWVMGYLLGRLTEADRSISTYRAREEVARTLHDGVLQTLAVIQRRSGDEELVTLARGQEQELRAYLFGDSGVEIDLASGLRGAARRAEDRYGLRVQVVIAPDLPTGTESHIQNISGAVGEALTNAAKHGRAVGATVYAEPDDDDGIFVSVKDDGIGFDTDIATEGEGLSRSIRGRLTEIGGRVEVDGRPGRGTEIRMWL